MLLLVSGASGVGKTTARLHARHLFERRRLDPTFETAELFTLGPIPAVPTIAWRQEQVEAAVRRAVALEAGGRHLLFAGPRHLATHPRAGGDRGRRLLPACGRRGGAGLPGRLVPRVSDVRAHGAALVEWRRAGSSR